MVNKTSRIIVILIIVVCSFSCSKKIDRSMLIGTYIANYKIIQSTILIKDDGTYDCHLITEDGEKLFNSNDWLLDDLNGRANIIFFNFDFKIRTYPKETVEKTNLTLGATVISDYKGRIKITIDDDIGLYYFKQ